MEIVVHAGDEQHNMLQIVIRGQMWSQPVPLELLLAADMDRRDGSHARARHARLSRAPMDPRLLRYYNQELRYLREMGGEFATEFPKIAARLGMEGLEVADPYVERLLEGCAFLAARVQLKLDAEFPRFSHRLLETAVPEPAGAVALDAGGADRTGARRQPAQGPRSPRGTALLAPRTA